MHLNLSDLPPSMQRQALKIIAEEDARRQVASVCRGIKAESRGNLGDSQKSEFDSRGEYEYYVGTILPKMKTGEVVKCEKHPAFLLYPKGEYGALKLHEIRYTADFRLEYADGAVEIVEVKSKFVRRMQRDYPVRRRVFIEQIARPAGWKFTEVITADSRDDIKAWKRAKEGER